MDPMQPMEPGKPAHPVDAPHPAHPAGSVRPAHPVDAPHPAHLTALPHPVGSASAAGQTGQTGQTAPADRPRPDEVLAAWAPAGMGRIVVVLGRGVVIHKAIVSGRAAVAGVTQGVTGSAPDAAYGSPFIEKVLRGGVEGLLASPRKTLVPWDEIASAEYRPLLLGRGRMTLRTKGGTHTLKFLQNTYVAGDPQRVFASCLGPRFTAG